MQKVNIKLHGHLGDVVGSEWNLCVKSVGEALRAIEIVGNHKLFSYLGAKDKEGCQYRVLINQQDFQTEKKLTINNIEDIKNSELVAKFEGDSLKSIDVVPVIEGAGDFLDILQVIIGVILIAVGLFTGQVYLAVAGLGLLASGVISLLSKPPSFGLYEDIQNAKTSYLFNGPFNVVEEGGPVPVGYGQLIVGSQVISASYDTTYSISDSVRTSQAFSAGDVDPYFSIRIFTNLNVPIDYIDSNGEIDKVYLPV